MMSLVEHDLLVAANGGRTIDEILKHKAFAKMTVEQRKSTSKAFYKRMWQLVHLFFSVVPIK